MSRVPKWQVGSGRDRRSRTPGFETPRGQDFFGLIKIKSSPIRNLKYITSRPLGVRPYFNVFQSGRSGVVGTAVTEVSGSRHIRNPIFFFVRKKNQVKSNPKLEIYHKSPLLSRVPKWQVRSARDRSTRNSGFETPRGQEFFWSEKKSSQVQSES